MKVKFTFAWSYGDTEEEIVEYDEKVSEEQIEKDYKFWLWDRVIGDKVGWEIIDDKEGREKNE